MENKNYIEEVAALLGVKLDEDFKIINQDGKDFGIYQLIDCGLSRKVDSEEGDDYMTDINSSTMTYLLTGTYKIEKLPFKPELGDLYWIPAININGEIEAHNFMWEDMVYDYLAYHLGLCFRTKEEAEQNKNKLKEIIGHYESV